MKIPERLHYDPIGSKLIPGKGSWLDTQYKIIIIIIIINFCTQLRVLHISFS